MFLRTFFRKNPLNLQLLFSHRFSTNSAPIISHDSHDHEAPHQEEHGASHDHGHGHHVKEYDWRDDPKINKELYVDIRDKGWNPDEYTFPYEGKMEWYRIFPENYDQSNLKLNFYSNRKKNENAVTSMRVNFLENIKKSLYKYIRHLIGILKQM